MTKLVAYMSKEKFFQLPSAEQKKKAQEHEVYKNYLKEGKPTSKPAKPVHDGSKKLAKPANPVKKDIDVEDTSFMNYTHNDLSEEQKQDAIKTRKLIENAVLSPEEKEELSSIAPYLSNGSFADTMFFDVSKSPSLQDLGKSIKYHYGDEIKKNKEPMYEEFKKQSRIERDYSDLLYKYKKAKDAGKNLNTPAMRRNIEQMKELQNAYTESRAKSDSYRKNISNIIIPVVKKYIKDNTLEGNPWK